MAPQERVNIAVFIDFDNIEIGVKSTLGEHFDIGVILEALKERGEVVTKIAYADWTRAGEYSRNLTQHAIRLVQRNLTPGGDKNGADINLALDALEMAFTHPHINAYVIVGGDSDFLSLVEKLKQYDKKVFVVGGRAFTSIILQRNCHEFIAYENLVRKPTARGGRPIPAAAASPIAQAFPIVRRALKILADREVSPQTGLLKSTLLQLDSTFSERSYGASSFLDFVEKLAQAGLVQLKHAGRSVMVELESGFSDESEGGTAAVDFRSRPPIDSTAGPSPEAAISSVTVSSEQLPAFSGSPAPASERAPEEQPEPLSRLGDNADGVREASRLMTSAQAARWPMYLRNVRQILRAGSFDERRYGFGGLIDLLRGCQKEGVVRLERDRRGGLRLFQGPSFRKGTPSEVEAASVVDVQASDAPSPESVEAVEVGTFIEASDVMDVDQPSIVVDTTAELLGRASPRRPRSRTPSPAPEAAAPKRVARRTRPASGARKAAAAKSPRTTRRPARSKTADDTQDN